jgi:hypothetical protein
MARGYQSRVLRSGRHGCRVRDPSPQCLNVIVVQQWSCEYCGGGPPPHHCKPRRLDRTVIAGTRLGRARCAGSCRVRSGHWLTLVVQVAFGESTTMQGPAVIPKRCPLVGWLKVSRCWFAQRPLHTSQVQEKDVICLRMFRDLPSRLPLLNLVKMVICTSAPPSTT